VAGPSMPWYPTAGLFRQSVHGVWDSVLSSVREELEALLPQARAGTKIEHRRDKFCQIVTPAKAHAVSATKCTHEEACVRCVVIRKLHARDCAQSHTPRGRLRTM